MSVVGHGVVHQAHRVFNERTKQVHSCRASLAACEFLTDVVDGSRI